MSFINMDDMALETNIRLKEIELVHMLEDCRAVSSLNFACTSANYCGTRFDFHQRTPILPIIYATHNTINQSVNQNSFNFRHELETMCSNKVLQSLAYTKIQTIDMRNTASYGYITNKAKIEYSHQGAIYPAAAKNMIPNIGKFKNNKRKNYTKPKYFMRPPINFAHVVVNMAELNLGRRCNKINSNLVIMKFRRVYIYLTSLCRERKILESIVLSKDLQANEKYCLPFHVNISGHVNYALRSLSAEIKFLDTVLRNIQQRCEDIGHTILYKDQFNKLIAAVNLLTVFNSPEAVSGLNNLDVICKVDSVLSAIIAHIRYLGVVCTITAQKLLIKETSFYEWRRRTYIGH